MHSIPGWIVDFISYSISATVVACIFWFVFTVIGARRAKIRETAAAEIVSESEGNKGDRLSYSQPHVGGRSGLAKRSLLLALFCVFLAVVPYVLSLAASAEQASSPTARGLLTVVTRGSSPTPADFVRDNLEKPLQEGAPEEKKNAQREITRKYLIKLLQEMDRKRNNDPQTLGLVAYGFLLIESSTKQWKQVRSTTEWAENNHLQSKDYGIAIQVYGAEAIVQEASSPDEVLLSDAVSKYKNINRQLNEDNNQFLSPIDFRRVDAKTFVENRLTELSRQLQMLLAQKALTGAQIWIYDMDEGSLAESLAKKLRDQDHLNGAVAKNPWTRPPFHELDVYYRKKPSDETVQTFGAFLSMPVNILGKRFLNYANSGYPTVIDLFTRNASLDYLILIPRQEQPRPRQARRGRKG